MQKRNRAQSAVAMAPLQQKQRKYTAADLEALLKFVKIERSGREDRDKDSPPWWPCLWFVNVAEMRGAMACNDHVRQRDISIEYTRFLPYSLNCPVALLLGKAAPHRCLFDVNPSEHPLTTVPLADHLSDFNCKYISYPPCKDALSEVLIFQRRRSRHWSTLNPPTDGPITIAAADATAGTTDTVFPQESRRKRKSVSLKSANGTEYERMDSDCGVSTQAKAAPSNKKQSPREDSNVKNKRLIAVHDSSDNTLSEGSDGCDHQTMRYSSTATPLVHRAGHEKKKETPFTRHMTIDLTDQDDSRWSSPNDKILQSSKVPPSSTIGNGPTVKSKAKDGHMSDGDNGDFSPLNPSISLMHSSGERNNAAVWDDSLPSTVEATGEGGGKRASHTRTHGEPDSAQGPASTNSFNPDKDVILGYEENEGCQRYRELVLSRAAEYQCSENWNKIIIVYQVMDHMEELGARFLLPVEGNSKLWRVAARTSVCQIVRESFCGCEWVPRKRKLVSDSFGRGLPKKLRGVDEAAAAVHNGTAAHDAIAIGGAGGSILGDAVPKQPQGHSHNNPSTIATTFGATACTSSQRYGLDTDMKHTDSKQGNGESSISGSNGEGNEAAAFDDALPWTLGVGDTSSNVAVVIVRLVVNCIIHLVRLAFNFVILGFTAYGVVAFVLTVNWYLNVEGK
jgi:hypothetical protein